MKRLREDWNAFWFAPRTGRVLGLYRIVIGLITIYSFALWAKDAAVFFSDDGVLTTRTLQSTLGRECHTLLKWIGSPLGVRIALGALFAAALAFTVGFYTRVSAIALYILVVSFHERNNLVLNGGDTVLRTMLFFFMFAPSGAAFSVDSLRRRLRSPGVEPLLISPWAQRMMQVQVAIIYFSTAYAKSRGSLYHDGTAMYYVFGLVDFNVRGVEQLMNFPLVYSSLTFAVLFVELAIPFLLWFRASRPYAVAMGLFAHGWIMVFMTIPVFGLLMVATYIPFFTEAELSEAIARVRRRFERRRAKVYFDGACPTCLRVRSALMILDVFGRMDAREARTAETPPGADRQTLLEEMVLVTARGRVLLGFDAYRWLLPRMPALFWTWPLWYLPGVAWAGRKLYRRIARGRSVLARCEGNDACEVRPASAQN
jgi:predicted DCC family thiol-disulfide oxidoreductase YuxK